MPFTSRDLILTGAMLSGVGLFALAETVAPDGSEALRFGGIALAFGSVVVHALRADEVQRALAMRAAAMVFALTTITALACAVFDPGNLAGAVLTNAWAAMFAAWILAWTALRLRLG